MAPPSSLHCPHRDFELDGLCMCCAYFPKNSPTRSGCLFFALLAQRHYFVPGRRYIYIYIYIYIFPSLNSLKERTRRCMCFRNVLPPFNEASVPRNQIRGVSYNRQHPYWAVATQRSSTCSALCSLLPLSTAPSERNSESQVGSCHSADCLLGMQRHSI